MDGPVGIKRQVSHGNLLWRLSEFASLFVDQCRLALALAQNHDLAQTQAEVRP